MIGKRLRFETKHPTEFVDLTDRLRDEVRRAGMRMGRLHLQSLHTTLGLAVNDTRRHLVPLMLVVALSMLRLVGRITRFDAPASVRRGYTIEEAERVARRVTAGRRATIRLFPFRFGLLLWK